MAIVINPKLGGFEQFFAEQGIDPDAVQLKDTSSGIEATLDSLVGNISGETTKQQLDAAAQKAQEQQQDIVQMYREQYQSYLDRAAPYGELGESALAQFAEFMTPEAQEAYAQEVLQSDAFRNIQQAAIDPLIANSAALGNRLSSGIQRDVLDTSGALATGYAQDMINQRLAQLSQGVNTGLSALSGTGAAGNAFASGAGNAMTNMANIGLQAANAKAAMPNMLGGLVGAGIGALAGGPAGAQVGYGIGSNV